MGDRQLAPVLESVCSPLRQRGWLCAIHHAAFIAAADAFWCHSGASQQIAEAALGHAIGSRNIFKPLRLEV